MASDDTLRLFGNVLRQLDEVTKALKSIEQAAKPLTPGQNRIAGAVAEPAVILKAAEVAAKATDVARDALQLYARLGGAQQARPRKWWWSRHHN